MADPAVLYAKHDGIATGTLAFREKRKPVFQGR